MRNALRDVARSCTDRIHLKTDDIIIDIGCNDGIMFDYFPDNVVKVGFDPAKNMFEESSKRAKKIFVNFFNADEYESYFGKKAKLITAIAVFYNLENPHKFMKDISRVLDRNGLFVIQLTDLYSMLRLNAIDNICHEHIEYYSLKSLNFLLRQYDMGIVGISYNTVNGGSLRAYVKFLNTYENSILTSPQESALNIYDINTLYKFVETVKNIKYQINEYVDKELSSGNEIYLYGASTKGNTLLQYCGLNYTHIKGALERNPDKWGKYIVGTNIPIISEEEGRKQKPNSMIVLPWHFQDEIIEREKEYLKAGGKLIFPMPKFKVIGG
jgi:SAM-dependent methyltransferase